MKRGAKAMVCVALAAACMLGKIEGDKPGKFV